MLVTMEELFQPLVVMRQWRLQSGFGRNGGVFSGVHRSVYAMWRPVEWETRSQSVLGALPLHKVRVRFRETV